MVRAKKSQKMSQALIEPHYAHSHQLHRNDNTTQSPSKRRKPPQNDRYEYFSTHFKRAREHLERHSRITSNKKSSTGRHKPKMPAPTALRTPEETLPEIEATEVPLPVEDDDSDLLAMDLEPTDTQSQLAAQTEGNSSEAVMVDESNRPRFAAAKSVVCLLRPGSPYISGV